MWSKTEQVKILNKHKTMKTVNTDCLLVANEIATEFLSDLYSVKSSARENLTFQTGTWLARVVRQPSG